MGYCMTLKNESFKIKAENVSKALQAIKALDTKEGHEHYAWVSNGFSKKAALASIMYEWRWRPEMNYDEYDRERDVFGICFEGEKLGDDQVLFDAIAPYVEPGSYIEMTGEDGCLWRWYFDGETCDEQYGETNYGEGYQEQVDYKGKHKAVLAELKMWAMQCREINKQQGGDASIARAEVSDILETIVRKHSA